MGTRRDRTISQILLKTHFFKSEFLISSKSIAQKIEQYIKNYDGKYGIIKQIK